MPKEKAACPVSRQEFDEHAEKIEVRIGDETYVLAPKHFDTGSLGWGLQGKTSLKINGKWVAVTIGLNVTLNNSKALPPRE